MHQPNLLYIFPDQLRARSLGYAGDWQAITPNIDRLAAQSVNFGNAITSSPVCTAYRASLLTGKYATSHGMVINELRIHPNQRCFGHTLTDAGYHTGYIGKWHLYANELGNHDDPRNSFVPRGPHRLGFDGEWMAYNFHHENYGTYYHTESPDKIFYGDGVYEPDAQTDLAIDFVRRAAQRPQPWAVFLSWGPPHDPWVAGNAPHRFWNMFTHEAFPNSPNYLSGNDEPYCDEWARLSEWDREQLEAWRRGYYAQVTSIDWNVGRLLRALDRIGAAHNTIVVFTSDHGEMFGAHGRRAKNIFYEEACHVPLLIRWPERITAGSTSDACLSSVDLLPTLLAMLELEPPAAVEGMDLSHCAFGLPGPEPDGALLQGCGATAAWEDGHEWRAVRTKQHTYARYRVDGSELLFDNVADPYQMHNLAGDQGHVPTLQTMRALLQQKMAAINDTFEACTFYRDHWTDGQRNIIRSATSDFS
jgi:arylsulfatase A-like enzyme